MEALGIEQNLLIAQIVNFLLFFIVFKKFVATPFLTFFRKEQKNEEEKQKALVQISKQKETLEAEEKEFKTQMKKSVEAEIAKAKEEAAQVREKLIADAHKEADVVITKAKEQLQEEKNNLYKEVQTKAADLAVMMVEKSLHDYLDSNTQKALTQHIIGHLSKQVEN